MMKGNTMSKRIGIFGGTFDPPHIGHLIVANEVLNHLKLHEVRFMPNHTPPHKEKANGVTNEQRVQMVQLAIKHHPQFSLELLEIERGGKSYTYDTIVQLKEREPENDFYFIIGGDSVEHLTQWHRIEELVSLVQFVGVNRPNYSSSRCPYPLITIEIPEIGISSSEIRNRLRHGQTVKYFLPDEVNQYIKEHRLYGAK
jgi:nicotinate-nucleotide adenylyltransferase